MVLGPNTNAPPTVLCPRCVLCAGEDRVELTAALQSLDFPPPEQHCAYRGYEFWRFPECCVILCGIGTGCLEPLLWEILRPRIVQRIVLIGSAGAMPGANVVISNAYAIIRAWAAGTGIDEEVDIQPLRPSWKTAHELPTATSVSSDFFYGFSPKITDGRYRTGGRRLRRLYQEHVRAGTQLVEMEVAQFYAFCEAFGRDELEYIAVKTVTNSVGEEDSQLTNTPGALLLALRSAMMLLNAPASSM